MEQTSMSPEQSDGRAVAKPWFELKREISVGYFRSYAMIYRHPLRVWVYGRWLIGKP
jgi:hypothetical protein